MFFTFIRLILSMNNYLMMMYMHQKTFSTIRTMVLIGAIAIWGAFDSRPAYRIFNSERGKSVDYDKMIREISEADVVFFGELHNNSMCHWLELQVLKSLATEKNNAVVLGAEMFEADAQLVLDEYLSGQIKEEHLIKEGKVWSNYKTDYAPLVNFAKDNAMPFVATNIPRRYASIVSRDGLTGLDKVDNQAKQFIAPLPVTIDFELPSYKEMAEMMGGQMPSAHGGKSMVEAQAIKDATMAHFISKNLMAGRVFYHINGSFHSKNNEGIIWYLKKSNPELRIRTIAVVEQDSLEEVEEDYLNQADFIMVVPSDMTKTY
jgi:uncharacterized iron-regulated protein